MTYNKDYLDIDVNNSTINGDYCTVNGNNNTINGDYCHIYGNNNTINGDYCHIYGNNNVSKGDYCHSYRDNQNFGSYSTRNKSKKNSGNTQTKKTRVFNIDKIEGGTFGNTGGINVITHSNNGISRISDDNGFDFDDRFNFSNTTFNNARFGDSNIINSSFGNSRSISFMSNVSITNNNAKFCRNGRPSEISIQDERYKFILEEGLKFTVTGFGFTVKSCPELKRESDGALVSNFYIEKQEDDKIIYKYLENEKFELILYEDKIECKEFWDFPKFEFTLNGQKREGEELERNKKKSKPSAPTLSPEEVKETDSEEITCQICFENKINTFILDCKHSIMCSLCAKKVKKCPKCRKKIVKGISDLYN